MKQRYKSFFMAMGVLLAGAAITMQLFSASLNMGLLSMSPKNLFSVGNSLLLINLALLRIALKAQR